MLPSFTFHVPFSKSIISSLIIHASPKPPFPNLSPIRFACHFSPKPSMSSSSSSTPTHVEAEYAKSGNSSCKKCSEPIENRALRLGTKDGRGYTKWHHLGCFSFGSESVASVELIHGFQALESSDQEALKVEFEKSKEEDSAVKKSSQNRRVREGDEAEVENLGEKVLKKSKGSSSAPTHVEAEYAKSGRSSCKKCSKPIENKALRLGLVTKDPRGFDSTKWHHLGCFSFGSDSVASVDKIKGFQSLKSSDQEALKNLAVEFEKCKKEDSNGEKNSQKQKVCEVDEDINEVGERGLKKAEVSDLAISFSASDVKDKYKDATLPPKWKAFQTIIFLERDDGLHDSSKIAAFDFDGCLANTDVRRVGADAWSFMYPSIPDKLRSLYEDGYKLVIFTNETNIERWKNKRQAAVDSKIGRLNNFIKEVKVPIQVFIACGPSQGEDPFRKPKPGMWHILKQHLNSGISIDMDQSFYVGDAAGRRNDHSDADLKFAEANGLKFYVPEDYFGV
ncbi:polynucleotide 3'-phosphatase ZDP [Argentina anserina]|uniref:polynucleotide 3'-phosphatase ZDP n=1 Tax=Argentina anserina TaxID=57926 RepID=UPI002176634A|nr:polynucleotide 3'-phosphatase ZDP [Potentilla anserina]